MKQLIVVFLFLFCSQALSAQVTLYGYDATGNRIIKYTGIMVDYKSGNVSLNGDSLQVLPPAEAVIDDTGAFIFPGESTATNATQQVINVVVYPNPTNGFLTLELFNLPDNETGNIFIINKMGQIVYNQNRLLQIQNINITSAPPDIYFIRITTGSRPTPIIISIIKY
jgi:hypothetical protein